MKLTKEMAEKIFSAKDYEEAKKTAAEVGYEMSEKEDAELKKYFTHELSDEGLDQVAGGYSLYHVFVGRNTTWNLNEYSEYEWDCMEGVDENMKYLCPHCGKPVYLDKIEGYYCGNCNIVFPNEDVLKPNLENWNFMGNVMLPEK